MAENLSQIAAEKIQVLPLEKQREALEFIEKLARSEKPQNKSPEKTLLEKLEDIGRRIPKEVLDEMPVDGAEQHDHYLYKTPKQ